MHECEARYWLQVLQGRCEGIVYRFGDISCSQIGEITQSLVERMRKKRGVDVARNLFVEMVRQWPEVKKKYFCSIQAVYGGEKYFLGILELAAT
ncbi:hypothetical protein [Teredinibacter turnerae]|uniref:hypothetical protein n=1 Tax=Teredinibacter turnerae TaxID=2426 RepID=UPI0003814860|nr:hypothetical protein [Teredinibacter turnerae]